jgi:hypothetical protein
MSPVGRRKDHQSVACWIVLVALGVFFSVGGDTKAETTSCGNHSPRVAEALARIRRSIDPCGESTAVRSLLAKLEQCSRQDYRYQICVDTSANRNVFDQPVVHEGGAGVRTVTWNPELRTELEGSCDGDPTRAVTRDPTASLLHELVHAVQDCEGLNPGDNELEAVRIENIYRRAAGLCQRTGYGTIALPAGQIRLCTSAVCSCLSPSEEGETPNLVSANRPDRRLHGDRPAE